MVQFDFNSKIVLVTGASRGIGKATARLFAQSGATVILHYGTSQNAAEELLRSLPGKGHGMVSANLAQPDQAHELVNYCMEHFGRVDVLVNNAGIYEEFIVMAASYGDWLDTWNRTLAINLTAPANLSFLVAQQMKDKGGCRIVNVSSRGAFRGEPDAPAYGASKAGLNSLGQSMAKALAVHNIYVFTVAPGFVETDMASGAMIGERGEEIINQSPMKRIASPEEVAQLIAFLASEGHDYMTGCIVDINGASYLRT